ncbi:hypothetical protein D3C79_803500 [compost metagenome]
MQAIAHLRVQDHRRLAGRLRMELGRKTDLEQHVFHHITAVRSRETERTLVFRLERQILVGVAEQYVVKPPLPGTQYTGNTHFAAHRHVRQTHATTGRIPRRPGFTRTGIRRMPIRAQCLTVSKGVRQRRQQLLAIGTHQLGGDCGRGHFHQNDVIEADTVERVFQGNHALNLMGHDHRFKHCAHGQRRHTISQVLL